MKFTNPTIVTITAPTCSGKSFLIERLCAIDGFKRVVSCTSRDIRPGEQNGVDYHFVDRSEFREGNLAKFVETNEFLGNMYGVPISGLLDAASDGIAAVVIVDPNGLEAFERVSSSFGIDLFKIFIHTPEEIKLQRLFERTREEIALAEPDAVEFQSIMDRSAVREQNIKTVERLWMTQRVWDAIVPGDNIEEALDLIERGVKYRNSRVAEPKPYIHEGA